MRRHPWIAGGLVLLMLIVGVVAISALVWSQPRPQHGLVGTEDGSTIWVKSCEGDDGLTELKLLRNGTEVWSYELVRGVGLGLEVPLDVKLVGQSTDYRLTGSSGLNWSAGDQIVIYSRKGYLSWIVGTFGDRTFNELDGVLCASS